MKEKVVILDWYPDLVVVASSSASMMTRTRVHGHYQTSWKTWNAGDPES